MNFNHLITDAENAEVNSYYSRCQKQLQRGVITVEDAQFMYAQFLINNYKRHAFTMYTNSPAFGGAVK